MYGCGWVCNQISKPSGACSWTFALSGSQEKMILNPSLIACIQSLQTIVKDWTIIDIEFPLYTPTANAVVAAQTQRKHWCPACCVM